MTPEILVGAVALILGPTGGVYIGIRAGLNGTREAVRRIESKVDCITVEVPTLRERVSLLEQRMATVGCRLLEEDRRHP